MPVVSWLWSELSLILPTVEMFQMMVEASYVVKASNDSLQEFPTDRFWIETNLCHFSNLFLILLICLSSPWIYSMSWCLFMGWYQLKKGGEWLIIWLEVLHNSFVYGCYLSLEHYWCNDWCRYQLFLNCCKVSWPPLVGQDRRGLNPVAIKQDR